MVLLSKSKHTLPAVLALLLAVFPATASGALVVTKEARQWAKEAVSREKALGALAAGGRSVGVLPFVQTSGDPGFLPLEKGLAVMIATDLSKVKGLDVLDRVKVQALIQELKLSGSGLVAEGTGPRIGRLLQAKWIVGGAYRVDKGSMDMDSRLLEVDTSAFLKSIQARGEMIKIFALEKQVVKNIIRVLGLTLTPQERSAIEAPITTSLEALLAFGRGLDASDRGDYKKAGEEYSKALKADPGFALAREALDELLDLGLLSKTRGKAGELSNFMEEIREDALSVTDTLGSEAATMRIKRPDEAEERGESPAQEVGPSSDGQDTLPEQYVPGYSRDTIGADYP